MVAALLSLLFVALSAHPAMAAQQENFVLYSGLKVMGVLALFIGVLLLLYTLSRRGVRLFPAARTGIINIIETKHLMPKKSLCLVEVRGKELLLGISGERIELLSYITPEEPTDSFQARLDREQEAAAEKTTDSL